MSDTRKAILVLVMIGIILISIVAIPKTTKETEIQEQQPIFNISGWTDIDGFAGLTTITLYENSTGDWELVNDYSPTFQSYQSGSNYINWTVGVGMKIKVLIHFNNTIVGASSVLNGRQYIKLNLSITDNANTELFSQQNFTYYDSGDGTSFGSPWYYYYFYTVIPNVYFSAGQIYKATIIYELFYME